MALQQVEVDAFLKDADSIANFSAPVFHDNRGQGTQDLIQMACKEFPRHNVMVIYTKHNLSEMKDCTRSEVTMRGQLGWPVKMQVYFFQSGIIENLGDGGYRNWAFGGNWERSGQSVKFFPRGLPS